MADKNDNDPIPKQRFTEEEGAENREALPDAPALVINGQYIKDLSFEAPNTPNVFNLLQNEMPNIQVDIDVQGEGVGEKVFEVILKVRAEATVKKETVYICELSYAGLFTLNLKKEQISPVLMIDCPLILFPFLRRVVADITGDGGFAPLMLAPVDFAALYQQRALQEQGQKTPEEG